MQNIGHSVHFLAQTESTNSYLLHQLPPHQKIHGTIVYTYDQTAGRGQRQNLWHSEPNKNIALSVYLSENLPAPENQFILNIISGLAVRSLVGQYTSAPVHLKWPNDVVINRKKISGILIENSIQGEKIRESIIGIGLNVNQTAWHSLHTATSLKTETSATKDYYLDTITDQLITALNRYWSDYLHGDTRQLWKTYDKHLYREGELRDLSGQQLDPSDLQRINPDGSLEILTPEGNKTYMHGQLQWEL